MSTISTNPTTLARVIQFKLGDSRRTVRLGVVSMKVAEGIRGHVDALVTHRTHGQPLSPATAAWVADIGDKLHGRLHAAGLVLERIGGSGITIGEMCWEMQARHIDWRPATAIKHAQAAKQLIAHFGERRAAASVTVPEAQDFRRAVRMKYAEASVAGYIACIRRFYKDAIERRRLAENPFTGVRAGSYATSRAIYVPRQTVLDIIKVTESPTFRVVLALARFGGLRMPSELIELRWPAIDLKRRTMRVLSPKTSGQGKPYRDVPIDDDLAAVLLEARELADDTGGLVVLRARAYLNLSTQAKKLIVRAGHQPWTRLYHSLRASLQTDWSKEHTPQDACQWLGNTLRVAANSYLLTTGEAFNEATRRRAANSDVTPNANGDKGRQMTETQNADGEVLIPENANGLGKTGRIDGGSIGPERDRKTISRSQESRDSKRRVVKTDATRRRRDTPDDRRLNRRTGAARRWAGCASPTGRGE